MKISSGRMKRLFIKNILPCRSDGDMAIVERIQYSGPKPYTSENLNRELIEMTKMRMAKRRKHLGNKSKRVVR